MIRKTYSALALLAVAGMVMVGCGKEDLTEMDTTWGKKDSDVVTKLDELKTKNEDLTRAFETLKTANIADTAKAGDRDLVDQMLKDHQTAIGEIEKDVNHLKAKREEALKTGKKADYEAARLLTLQAAWMADNSRPNSLEASLAKAKAGRTCVDVALKCVELAGSIGYTETALLEKWSRDAKILDIFEGTQQIQLLIIARRLLGKSSAELK